MTFSSALAREHCRCLLAPFAKQSTSQPKQPLARRSTSRRCSQLDVSIDLRSDSSGAIGVASRRGLQRLRHLDVRFLWLQQETAHKKVRLSEVPGPENVADANTKPTDRRRSLEFCRMSMSVTEIPKQLRDAVL